MKHQWIKCGDGAWVNLDQIEYIDVAQDQEGLFSVRAYGKVACDHIIAIFETEDGAYEFMNTFMQKVQQ